VLNDEWVSHPTWASEESGFVAHKKNTYEEALHKSEEERHEYQVHLDSLVRTISIFEPLNARVEEMSNDERNSWRLKADFGGPSKWIYHKTIKKIYGRDSGTEVIQALQECPGVAIPVVLNRLKQKEEDWRRAMREWGRMWKEVDAKNFYKSLDHQGLVFKSNDKKAITAKHFVNDVETIKLEQKEKLEAELDGDDGGQGARRSRSRRSKARRSRRGRQQRKRAHCVFKSLGFQLDYSFADTSVLHDCLKLVYSYLDLNPSQYSSQERRSVERFLQSFIPTFCYLPVTEFSHGFEAMDEDPPFGPGSHEGRIAGETSQQEAGDNKLLLNKKTSMDEEPTHSQAENKQPVKVSPCETWIREPVQSGSGGQEAGNTIVSGRPFFGNTTFYTLLRLIQVCVGRVIDYVASDYIPTRSCCISG
jgi:paired amphipathic helix protein Sin3a